MHNPYAWCIKVGRRSYLRTRPINDTYNKHVWMVHQRCVLRCMMRHVLRCVLRCILRRCFAMRRIAVETKNPQRQACAGEPPRGQASIGHRGGKPPPMDRFWHNFKLSCCHPQYFRELTVNLLQRSHQRKACLRTSWIYREAETSNGQQE